MRAVVRPRRTVGRCRNLRQQGVAQGPKRFSFLFLVGRRLAPALRSLFGTGALAGHRLFVRHGAEPAGSPDWNGRRRWTTFAEDRLCRVPAPATWSRPGLDAASRPASGRLPARRSDRRNAVRGQPRYRRALTRRRDPRRSEACRTLRRAAHRRGDRRRRGALRGGASSSCPRSIVPKPRKPEKLRPGAKIGDALSVHRHPGNRIGDGKPDREAGPGRSGREGCGELSPGCGIAGADHRREVLAVERQRSAQPRKRLRVDLRRPIVRIRAPEQP